MDTNLRSFADQWMTIALLVAKETREHASLGREISILGCFGCLSHLGRFGHFGRSGRWGHEKTTTRFPENDYSVAEKQLSGSRISRKWLYRFPEKRLPGSRKMAQEAVGGNLNMDTRVIKVADFKSEVIWPPWSFGGRHGLRYIYLGNWGHRASHAYFSSPLAPLIYRAIALLLTPYVYALSVSSGEPLRSKLLKNENQRR